MEFLVTTTNAVSFSNKELAVELVNGGEITPNMSVKEISRVVKAYTTPEQDEPETDEPETDKLESEPVSVWDKDGNEYAIPADILNKYRVLSSSNI